MADHLDPTAPLIAETGGPERHAGGFDRAAGTGGARHHRLQLPVGGPALQALRCLYVQEDVADTVTEMLFGAMEDLALGDPWHLSTDVGPVIDAEAQAGIRAYVDAARAEGRVLKEMPAPGQGTFIAPTVLKVTGIRTCRAKSSGRSCTSPPSRRIEIDAVIEAINATGYGLTFGLHSRIDDRVQRITSRG
jgi:RHH-type proline utilization regulon transcriptional repressor/proline dehydrogenase/delta 1-pyrroline-5-carboxylate dehydrogenase